MPRGCSASLLSQSQETRNVFCAEQRLKAEPCSSLRPVRPGSRRALALTSSADAAHGGRLFPAAAGCCPGRSSGRLGDDWGHTGGRRRSAALRVPHPGSHLAFSHTLGLLLYLSLIIRPALRNPRLPLRQLLLIYPPRLRNTRWHRSLRMGRAGDEGRGMPVAPGTCPSASAGLGRGVPVSRGTWQFLTASRLPSGAAAPFLFPRPLAGIAALGESKPVPADVELQKLTPCGETAVAGNRPGTAGGAGNRRPCSIVVMGATAGAVVLEPLELRDGGTTGRPGALVLA